MVDKALTIIGIDPGYGRCGWGVITIRGHHHQALAHGVIETSPEDEMSQRLVQLHLALKKKIMDYQPDEAAVENLYFSKNVKTAIDVGQARGVILLTCAQMNLPLTNYNPNEIKQSVTGYGQADKRQIQHMIKMILSLDKQPKLDDAADALAVAICHAQNRNSKRILSTLKVAGR